MLESMLIRYGEPSKYDHAPYGTICKCVKNRQDLFEVYVQINEEDSFPFWEKVGIFSEETKTTIEKEAKRILRSRKVSSVQAHQ